MYNKIKDLTLVHFIKTRLHLGHSKNNLHYLMRAYTFVFRHNITIFDIEKFWIPLRFLYANLTFLFQRRNSFLLIATNQKINKIDSVIDAFNFEFSAKEKKKMCYIAGFITQKWVYGLLSNWKVTLDLLQKIQKKAKIKKKYKNYLYFFRGIILNKQKPVHPDFVFLLNKDKNAIKEILSIKMPILGIVDSNTNPYPFLYHFFGNDDSLNTIFFFFILFVMLLLMVE